MMMIHTSVLQYADETQMQVTTCWWWYTHICYNMLMIYTSMLQYFTLYFTLSRSYPSKTLSFNVVLSSAFTHACVYRDVIHLIWWWYTHICYNMLMIHTHLCYNMLMIQTSMLQYADDTHICYNMLMIYTCTLKYADVAC